MSSKLKNEAVANATVSFLVSLFLVNDNDNFKPIYDEDGNITGLDEADKQQVFDYYKGLIAFRKAHAAFRMTTEEQVTENILAIDGLEANVTAFAINGGVNGDGYKNLFYID